VKKGEKGIRILAPIIGARHKPDEGSFSGRSVTALRRSPRLLYFRFASWR
jgi:hypothetical protein